MDVFVEDLAESVKRLTDELSHRVRHEERLRKVIDDNERRINELEAHCMTLNSDINTLESEYDKVKDSLRVFLKLSVNLQNNYYGMETLLKYMIMLQEPLES